jgi:hypothetical protein
MQKVASDAMNEVEAILFVADAAQGVRERDAALLERLKKAKAPVIGFVNKCDLAGKAQADAAQTALEAQGFLKTVLRGSAQTGEGLDLLETELLGCLTEGPQYFPEDMVTDQPERVICAELIREKALMLLRERGAARRRRRRGQNGAAGGSRPHGCLRDHLLRAGLPQGHRHRQERVHAQADRPGGAARYGMDAGVSRESAALGQNQGGLAEQAGHAPRAGV